MSHLVEIEPGVWLARWAGDPGRTLIRENAQQFPTEANAQLAIDLMLKRYLPGRPHLKRAKIVPSTPTGA